MTDYVRVERTLVRSAIAAGLAASVMYPARTFLTLPEFLSTAFYIFFGPVLVVAFVGLYPFLSRPKTSVAAVLGTVFGVIGGAANMVFAVVQLENLHYIRKYMAAAETVAEKEMWQNILNGVFTVQNGFNYVSDFFIDWTAFLWAFVMWNHPKFGKAFTLTGLAAAGLHFIMKLITFPEPPAEAGLFDAGPLVSIWFALVTVQVIRKRRWMEEW
ncbi:MAG: hypothetical protein OEM23_05715 [Gemmatimonadota bacterium]|nr:hypothetical protein [Gemmatimonadota bacterium]MDH3427915.1 hypothetical protein [Gemmatimonadota bacterium]